MSDNTVAIEAAKRGREKIVISAEIINNRIASMGKNWTDFVDAKACIETAPNDVFKKLATAATRSYFDGYEKDRNYLIARVAQMIEENPAKITDIVSSVLAIVEK